MNEAKEDWWERGMGSSRACESFAGLNCELSLNLLNWSEPQDGLAWLGIVKGVGAERVTVGADLPGCGWCWFSGTNEENQLNRSISCIALKN